MLSYLVGKEQSGGGMDEGTLFFISHCRTGLMAQVQFQGFPYKSMPCKLNKTNRIFIEFTWQAVINLYIIEQYLLFVTCFEVEAKYWDTMSLYDFDPVSAILSF